MSEERHAGRLEVLVVSNDDAFVARLERALGRGYALTVAGSSELDAIDDAYLIVIADLRHLDFAEVRASRPDAVVIVVSDSGVDVMEALNDGAWDFLTPRADARQIRAVLRRAAAYARIAVEAAGVGTHDEAERVTELLADVRKLTTTLRREKRRLTARSAQRGS